MPCAICKQKGHNRVTCPQKANGQVSGETSQGRVEEFYPPLTAPPISPIQALQDEIESLNKEKNNLVNEVKSLKTYTKYLADEWAKMRDHSVRLQDHINSLRKANVVCDMQLRKDIADVLFDKKSDIPDGIYLELMNKLRI